MRKFGKKNARLNFDVQKNNHSNGARAEIFFGVPDFLVLKVRRQHLLLSRGLRNLQCNGGTQFQERRIRRKHKKMAIAQPRITLSN